MSMLGFEQTLTELRCLLVPPTHTRVHDGLENTADRAHAGMQGFHFEGLTNHLLSVLLFFLL